MEYISNAVRRARLMQTRAQVALQGARSPEEEAAARAAVEATAKAAAALEHAYREVLAADQAVLRAQIVADARRGGTE